MAPRALRENPAVPVGRATVAAVAWRYRGELRVTAIVKATFAFAPNVAMTRAPPEAIAREDGVRAVSDLAPYLKRADVIFTGGAAAAGAQVGLAIAGGAQPLLDKTVIVGAGGAAFGPVPRGAPVPALGRHVTEIASTFDWDLFQAAPVDQRTDYLRGDEWLVIEGLHRAHAELRVRLPGARAQARIYGLSRWGFAEGKALAMNADVLQVRGDDDRCTLTWRGSFALPDEAAIDAVKIVAGVELPGEPIAWPDRAEALWGPEPAAGARGGDGTLPLSESDVRAFTSGRDATVPLDEGASKPGWSLDKLMKTAAARPPAAAPAAAQPSAVKRGVQDQTLGVSADATRSPVLPFVEGPSDPPAIRRADPRPRPAARRPGDETLGIPDGSPRPPTLPFEKNAPKGEAASDPPAAAPPPAEAPPSAKPPAKKEILVSSPLADAPPERKPAPPPKAPEKKLPPKVDVAGKLYGAGKKR